MNPFSTSLAILLAATLASPLSAAPTVQTESATLVSAVPVTPIRNLGPTWEHRSVRLRGMLDRALTEAGPEAIGMFLLRDEFGHVVRVRSSEETPDRRVIYEIAGTVSIDRRGNLYVTEETRDVVPLASVDELTRASRAAAVVDNSALVGGGGPAPTVALTLSESPSNDQPTEASVPGWIWLFSGLGLGLLTFFGNWLVGRVPPQGSTPGGPRRSAASPHGEERPTAAVARSGAEPSPSLTASAPPAAVAVPRSATVRVLPACMEFEGASRPPLRFFAAPRGSHQVSISIGREQGDPYSHVQLDEHTVSRQQARLTVLDGRYELENLSDTNPTLVNGRSMGSRPIGLSDGDQIQLGGFQVRFRERVSISA